jgi:hypothetical protein
MARQEGGEGKFFQSKALYHSFKVVLAQTDFVIICNFLDERGHNVRTFELRMKLYGLYKIVHLKNFIHACITVKDLYTQFMGQS